LRAAVLLTLPDYLGPARFVHLDAWPLTPSGKIDRKALPAPEAAAHAGEYVAPRNDLEQELASIWSDVLKVARVGIHDNFFVLGGHSLLAMQLIYRVKDTFHVQLTPDLVFDQPTIAHAAVVIEQLILAEIDKMSDDEAASMAAQ
jgi:acyl carrier protein